MDIADAERVLADLVSKSRFIEITSEESDEVNKEGAVPRLDEMGPRPEEGQASEGGSATCAHDVDEAALHASVSDVGRPLVCVQRSASSGETFTKDQGLGHPPDPAT